MKITDLIKKNTLRNIHPATPATPATFGLHKEAVATVATVAKGSDQNSRINIRIESDKKPTEYDSYCWPNSSAFNSGEVRLTLERLRFLGSRLSEGDADEVEKVELEATSASEATSENKAKEEAINHYMKSI